MGTKRSALATVPPPSPPAAPAPAATPVTLDLRKQTITLMPLDIRLRAASLTADAIKLTSIESIGALETADAVAAGLKTIEAEIITNMAAQLEPLKHALAAAEEMVAEVLKPLAEARKALAVRVVEATAALGYEESTSCYVQHRDDLEIRDASEIPLRATWTDKKGVKHEEVLLVPDNAAITRTLKGGTMVRGVYLGKKPVYGIKGAK